MENIQIQNVRSYQAGKDAAMFIAVQKEGQVRNVTVDGLQCRARGIAIIQGTDRDSIRHIRLRNCEFLIEPTSKLFGNGLIDPLIHYWVSDLGPYNLYLRHASDLRFENMEVTWGESDLADIMEIADASRRPAEYADLWRPDMYPSPAFPCVQAYDIDGLTLRDVRCTGFGGAEAIRTELVTGLSVTD